jgi:ribosomal-protein-alanine N-acetyltransferase
VIGRLLARAERSTGSVRLEPMHRRHLRDVLAIERGVYPKPWTERIFTDEIEMMHRGQRWYLVARVGRDVVGYCGALLQHPDVHVTNVAVNPEWQGRGVATRMLLALAHRAVAAGYDALTLEVRSSNVGAQALYRRFGFAPVGVRQKYYENTEDAIVMWCHDIAEPPYRRRLEQLCPEVLR